MEKLLFTENYYDLKIVLFGLLSYSNINEIVITSNNIDLICLLQSCWEFKVNVGDFQQILVAQQSNQENELFRFVAVDQLRVEKVKKRKIFSSNKQEFINEINIDRAWQ